MTSESVSLQAVGYRDRVSRKKRRTVRASEGVSDQTSSTSCKGANGMAGEDDRGLEGKPLLFTGDYEKAVLTQETIDDAVCGKLFTHWCSVSTIISRYVTAV